MRSIILILALILAIPMLSFAGYDEIDHKLDTINRKIDDQDFRHRMEKIRENNSAPATTYIPEKKPGPSEYDRLANQMELENNRIRLEMMARPVPKKESFIRANALVLTLSFLCATMAVALLFLLRRKS